MNYNIDIWKTSGGFFIPASFVGFLKIAAKCGGFHVNNPEADGFVFLDESHREHDVYTCYDTVSGLGHVIYMMERKSTMIDIEEFKIQ